MADDDFIDDSELTARADALSDGMPAVPTHTPTEGARMQSKGGKAARASHKEKKQDDLLAEKAHELQLMCTDYMEETDEVEKIIKLGALMRQRKEYGESKATLDKFKGEAKLARARLAAAKRSKEDRDRAHAQAREDADKTLYHQQRREREQLLDAITALVSAHPAPLSCFPLPRAVFTAVSRRTTCVLLRQVGMRRHPRRVLDHPHPHRPQQQWMPVQKRGRAP